MKLVDVIAELDLTVLSGNPESADEIQGGYAGDLLSDVLGNARTGDLWVTMQIHRNIVAVATSRELSGIVLVRGRQPAAEVIATAEREGVILMVSSLNAFELSGRLYEMGLGARGRSGENV